MDWIENLNASVEYIESHLSDEISYDRPFRSRVVLRYQFQRMFSYITGVPLSEYIRRRRFTIAAYELQTGNAKVIDTVLEVPAATWTVFDVPDCDMQAMWKRIWTEWMPVSGYEGVEGASFEMYYGLASHENVFGEIWIPVRKK